MDICQYSPSYSHEKMEQSTSTASEKKKNPQQPSTGGKQILARKDRVDDKTDKQEKLIGKVSKSMVGWIQVASWTKDFDIEGVILSINILNSFFKYTQIQKSKVSALLASILLISSKYVGKPTLSLNDVHSLASTNLSQSEISLLEAHILFLLDYDLAFPNFLLPCLRKNTPQQQRHKICFVTELMLLYDSKITEKEEKMKQIVRYVRQEQKIDGLGQKILSCGESENLYKKYRSYFDVDEYVQMMRQNILP